MHARTDLEAAGLGAGQGVEAVVDVHPQLPTLSFVGCVQRV